MKERRPPTSRSDYRVFQTVATRWSDNDAFGHMNNVVHYSLFDAAIATWLMREAGIDYPHGTLKGFVVESGCRYFSELGFPRPVDVGVAVETIGRSSVRYRIGLFDQAAETCAADGFLTHVYTDAATRKPQELPERFRAALEMIVSNPP